MQFQRLTDINKADIIALMNNSLVRRQMPLLVGDFSEPDCERFVAAKEQLWNEYGYGPWAIVVDGVFAGWGGLQPEQGDADLALVLHPDFWGIGKRLYQIIIDKAFSSMGLNRITVLLPPTRTRVAGLLRLGFVEDGSVAIDGQRFIRYRLDKANV